MDRAQVCAADVNSDALPVGSRLNDMRGHCRPAKAYATRSLRAGYSLIEVMTVVVIVGILAGAVVTHARPNVAEGLRGAARIVAADIQRVRELAVAGSSTYHIAFDMDQEFYRLMHTGADPGLDTLPRSPFGDPTDSPTQWTQRLGDLPLCGPSVGLFVVLRGTPVPQTVFDVEFGPLGETTQSSPTVIWLASGSGNARRYISVTVNPVTGNCSIGDVQATPP